MEDVGGAHSAPPTVVVGRDPRLHSPRLFAALTDGLRVHADVIDIGVVPTPVVYFAAHHLAPAAPALITATPTPAEATAFNLIPAPGRLIALRSASARAAL